MSIPIRNTPQRYGIIAILLHWTMAALLIGMFLLGNYMVDLDYYHPWYQKAPDLHRSLGVVVAALLLLRWLWRLLNPLPTAPGGPWERFAARQAQRLFYLSSPGRPSAATSSAPPTGGESTSSAGSSFPPSFPPRTIGRMSPASGTNGSRRR